MMPRAVHCRVVQERWDGVEGVVGASHIVWWSARYPCAKASRKTWAIMLFVVVVATTHANARRHEDARKRGGAVKQEAREGNSSNICNSRGSFSSSSSSSRRDQPRRIRAALQRTAPGQRTHSSWWEVEGPSIPHRTRARKTPATRATRRSAWVASLQRLPATHLVCLTQHVRRQPFGLVSFLAVSPGGGFYCAPLPPGHSSRRTACTTRKVSIPTLAVLKERHGEKQFQKTHALGSGNLPLSLGLPAL